jgi:hypothetical protein
MPKPSKQRTRGPSQETLRSFSRQLPSGEEFNEIQNDLIGSSDRTVAITASSILELTLEKLIITALPRSKKVINQLNGRDGALSGFYSKSYLGYAMSLYGDDVLAHLETIRKIRNAFAHTGRPIKFTTPIVGRECSKLTFGKSDRKEWPDNLSRERVAFTAACMSLTKVFLAKATLTKIRSLAGRVSPELKSEITSKWEDHPFYSKLAKLLGAEPFT